MDVEQRIVENMGLVYKHLHKFNLAYDDEAFSYAVEALMKAARTYKEDKKIQFSTYATACIYNGICMYLRAVRKSSKLDTISYDEPVSDDSNEFIKDLLTIGESTEDLYLQKELKEMLYAAAKKVLGTMSDTSKKICMLWWNSDFTLKQRELSDIMHLSQTTVSRTLSEFKNKIKEEMEDYL